MFKTFCDMTSFHGFKDFVDAKHNILKSFWVILIAVSLAMTCFEINRLRLSYYENPVATQITFKSMPEYQFPHLALCPVDWANDSKIEQLPLSNNALLYAASFIYNVSIKMNKTTIKVARDEFITYLNSMNYTVINFYKSLMVHPPNILEIQINQVPGLDLSYDFNSQYGGLGKFCFVTSFPPLNYGPLLYFPFSFVLLHKNTAKKNASFNPFVDYSSTSILFSSQYKNVRYNYEKLVDLKENIAYKVSVRASYAVRISTDKYRCKSVTKENKLYNRRICQSQCVLEKLFEQNCCSCFNFGLSDNVTYSKPDTYPLCTFLDKSMSDYMHSHSTDCAQRLAEHCAKNECLPFCEQWRYEYAVFQETIQRNNSPTEIHFVFNPVDGILHSEEVSIYEWSTFVSNIGGHLGLWMGGSVLSIAQLIYYIAVFLGRQIGQLLKGSRDQKVEHRFPTGLVEIKK